MAFDVIDTVSVKRKIVTIHFMLIEVSINVSIRCVCLLGFANQWQIKETMIKHSLEIYVYILGDFNVYAICHECIASQISLNDSGWKETQWGWVTVYIAAMFRYKYGSVFQNNLPLVEKVEININYVWHFICIHTMFDKTMISLKI